MKKWLQLKIILTSMAFLPKKIFKKPTSYLVYILEWETEGLVCGPLWWVDVVEGSKEGLARGWAILSLLHLPLGPPFHVLGDLQHVVSMPSRDWHEGNGIGVVSDLLDVSGHFLLDFIETSLQETKVILIDNNYDRPAQCWPSIWISVTPCPGVLKTHVEMPVIRTGKHRCLSVLS